MCTAMGGYCRELLGEGAVSELEGMAGSEDFTAIAERVPSVYLHPVSYTHLSGMHLEN